MRHNLSQLYCSTTDSVVADKCRTAISAFPGRFRFHAVTRPSQVPAGVSLEDWLIFDASLLQTDSKRWLALINTFAGQLIWLTHDNTIPDIHNRLPVLVDLNDPEWVYRVMDVLEPFDGVSPCPRNQDGLDANRGRTITNQSIEIPNPPAANLQQGGSSILKIASDLNSLDRNRIVDVIMEELVPSLGVNFASLYVVHAEKQSLELLRHTHGYAIDPVVPFNQTNRPMTTVAQLPERSVQIITDWTLAPFGNNTIRRYAHQYAADQAAILPIVDRRGDGSILAILNLSDRPGLGFDSERDLPVLTDWANLIARAWINGVEHDRALRAAGTDALTGLGNYRIFTERLAQETERGRRYGMPLSMIMLDVDNLKKVNDVHGHPGGDVLLKTVAKRITEEIRNIDQAARLGGDEFAVILPSTDLKAAKAVANRVLRSVARRPFRWKGTTIQPAVSVGVGQFEPNLSIRQFIHRVDQSLYTAKSSGRNCVSVCE